MGYPKDKLAGSHQLQRGAVRLIGRGGRDSRPGSPSEMTCTICHDDSGPGCGQEVRVLDCGHRFHEDVSLASRMEFSQFGPKGGGKFISRPVKYLIVTDSFLYIPI